MMRKLAIVSNLLLFLTGLTLELTGAGLVTRWRTHTLYPFIAETGCGDLFTFLYFVFFLVLPFVNFVALIAKDRGVLIEEARR
jgi:hypothetical protein